MQPSLPRQPGQTPRRGQPFADPDAPARDATQDTGTPSQGLYGELVPPAPQPDWDWAPDNERRRR